nr:HIT family protein [Desulfonatronum thiosulfatophilum]
MCPKRRRCVMSECIFCSFAQRKIPCELVYSSRNTMAFLDIAPVHPGHVLVIPKAHHPTLWDLPAGLGEEMLETMQKVSKALVRAVNAQGLNVVMNNHKAAGQLVEHAHFHLIPRYENDGLRAWPQSSYPSSEEMRAVADLIKKELA